MGQIETFRTVKEESLLVGISWLVITSLGLIGCLFCDCVKRAKRCQLGSGGDGFLKLAILGFVAIFKGAPDPTTEPGESSSEGEQTRDDEESGRGTGADGRAPVEDVLPNAPVPPKGELDCCSRCQGWRLFVKTGEANQLNRQSVCARCGFSQLSPGEEGTVKVWIRDYWMPREEVKQRAKARTAHRLESKSSEVNPECPVDEMVPVGPTTHFLLATLAGVFNVVAVFIKFGSCETIRFSAGEAVKERGPMGALFALATTFVAWIEALLVVGAILGIGWALVRRPSGPTSASFRALALLPVLGWANVLTFLTSVWNDPGAWNALDLVLHTPSKNRESMTTWEDQHRSSLVRLDRAQSILLLPARLGACAAPFFAVFARLQQAKGLTDFYWTPLEWVIFLSLVTNLLTALHLKLNFDDILMFTFWERAAAATSKTFASAVLFWSPGDGRKVCWELAELNHERAYFTNTGAPMPPPSPSFNQRKGGSDSPREARGGPMPAHDPPAFAAEPPQAAAPAADAPATAEEITLDA